jgi:hypothetical protein
LPSLRRVACALAAAMIAAGGVALGDVTLPTAGTDAPDSTWRGGCAKAFEQARAVAAKLDPRFATATVSSDLDDGPFAFDHPLDQVHLLLRNEYGWAICYADAEHDAATPVRRPRHFRWVGLGELPQWRNSAKYQAMLARVHAPLPQADETLISDDTETALILNGIDPKVYPAIHRAFRRAIEACAAGGFR